MNTRDAGVTLSCDVALQIPVTYASHIPEGIQKRGILVLTNCGIHHFSLLNQNETPKRLTAGVSNHKQQTQVSGIPLRGLTGLRFTSPSQPPKRDPGKALTMNATKPDTTRALERIRLMIPRTPANGCTSSETDSAARAIGLLVMRFPELLDANQNTESQQLPDGETIEVYHSGILAETSKAVLFLIRGQQCWLPRSQMTSFDRRSVRMAAWLAHEKGFAR